MREPCLQIPVQRQEFISWRLIALELLTAVSPPRTPDCPGRERPSPCPKVSLGRPCPSTRRAGPRAGWHRGLPGIPHLLSPPLKRGLEWRWGVSLS